MHPNAQYGSQFLQQLPVEIRKIIYDHVWEEGRRKHHIYMKDGCLAHARCVMLSEHEDSDFIQKAMDRERDRGDMDGFRNARMQMWHTRLMSTWGHRHWNCKQDIEYSDLSRDSTDTTDATDTTDFMSMMLICKLM